MKKDNSATLNTIKQQLTTMIERDVVALGYPCFLGGLFVICSEGEYTKYLLESTTNRSLTSDRFPNRVRFGGFVKNIAVFDNFDHALDVADMCTNQGKHGTCYVLDYVREYINVRYEYYFQKLTRYRERDAAIDFFIKEENRIIAKHIKNIVDERGAKHG